MKIRILLLAVLKTRSALSDPSPSEEVFRRNGPRGKTELIALFTLGSADFNSSNLSTAAILGKYLYIDGGYVSGPAAPKCCTTAKDTFAIDISKSWDPKDAKFLKLASETRKKGVYRSGFLWKLVPDGNGNGTWSSEITTGIAGLVSTESSAHTVAHGLGFWFGGGINELTERTSNAAAIGTSVPGFVTYNFTAKTWTNHTDVPDAVKSPWAATATYIPDVGLNGIIVLIGGLSSTNSPLAIDFGTIYLMDPVTMVWYNQKASASGPLPLPTRRMDHCAVGVQGDNNTYEIFMYGGARDASDKAGKDTPFGDVWVLSLPGFVWHQADGAGINPRTHHACVRAGNRQMLSIGGVNTTGSDGMSTKDSLPQGLGIFDMTRMEWKETYNADAEPYATPEIIKKWYADGGADSVTWGDGVQDLYQNKTPSQPKTSDQSLSVGAIAGISIGTVAGVIALVIATFLFIRKYQRIQTEKHHELETSYPRPDGSLSAVTLVTTRPQPTEPYSTHPELGGDTQRIAMRDSLQVPGQIPADRRMELQGD